MPNRDFGVILGELDDGDFVDKCSFQLSEVVRAVRKSGKKGKVTVTLELDPDESQIIITSKVEAKIPMPSTPQKIYFATDAGELVRESPRQEPLRGTERPSGPRPISNFEAPHKGV
jgi:hypothetical protein